MIKRTLYAAFAGMSLLATGCAHAQNTNPQPPENLSIYLLMGQSNMSGRGNVSELPDDQRVTSGTIWVYGNDGVWRLAAEPLDDATGQIDAVSSDGDKAGVGPGLTFARHLRAPQKGAIALVPCAKGGSSLSQWTPTPDRNRLYGSCMARATEASAKGQIVGVLWYQGETDAEKPEAAAIWGERMMTLITRLRSDLKAPCLPWVVVGLSDRPDPVKWRRPTEGWAQVQAAQKELPQQIKGVAHVSALGLAKNSDDIHLSTAGQLVLGEGLAEAMARLHAQPCTAE